MKINKISLKTKKIPRFYQNLSEHLKENRVLVIYGPRQVGKTTLLQSFLSKTKLKYKLDNGDNIRTQQILGSQDFSKIFDYISGYKLLALDEAQRIAGIGMGLKILVDNVEGIFIIATGSASFELSGQIGEPLTGRKKTIILYPLSQLELVKLHTSFELKEKLSQWLIFGSYPEVVVQKKKEEKKIILEEIADSYLLKDILEMERIKERKVLLDLLKSLAFQVGSEVSLTELSSRLGVDYKTVGRYLDLLERSFVIYNLRGFSRNLRKEMVKKSKYYFWDNGIRNAVISNFNDLDSRDDVGKLWENFLVIERLKFQNYKGPSANNYFWRTWDKKEIDWLEERGGKLYGYEFKWGKGKVKPPKDFLETYSNSEFKIINKENYLEFVGVK